MAVYLGSSIAAKQANGEPWSSVVLRTGILAGICVGSILLCRLARYRVFTIGRLVLDRSQLITELTTLEDRERETLSEDLHDGALQYVLAARQDLEEGAGDGRSDRVRPPVHTWSASRPNCSARP